MVKTILILKHFLASTPTWRTAKLRYVSCKAAKWSRGCQQGFVSKHVELEDSEKEALFVNMCMNYRAVCQHTFNHGVVVDHD